MPLTVGELVRGISVSVGLLVFVFLCMCFRMMGWVGCMLRVLGGTIGGANLYYLMLVHVADIGSYL